MHGNVTLRPFPTFPIENKMSEQPEKTHNPLLEDERKNPVYRMGQAVAGFMLVVWVGVLALVFFLVFRFWLS
ncbi:hypothetical protein HMPREF0602_0607 [Neisseria meningitidis ATCC 13091]|uniref:Uncharacterized protein n=2 Tax=Neisseria meningitidis TaxID=487 RepID=E0N7X7_NEIM3|nr:hypothetical protein HMPREF0602_0607 [Neisseria meningitidis ATCC 13091]